MIKNLALCVVAAVLLATSCTKPQAAFELAATGEVAPATLTFTNNSTHADTYFWEFGDGNTSTEATPSHTYEYWGTYTVTLHAKRGNQTNVATQTLTLKEPPRRKVAITTSLGTMTVELSNLTPKHRDNFVKLAQEGYYDGLLFHRVIQGFMVQGGDPDSRNAPANRPLGMGGPGYTIPAELRDGMYHYKGALAAARQGDEVNPTKASSGSQFYLVQGSPIPDVGQLTQLEAAKNYTYTTDERAFYLRNGGAPFLDRDYTVFGYVTEGFEVLDKIAAIPTQTGDRPAKDLPMTVRVLE